MSLKHQNVPIATRLLAISSQLKLLISKAYKNLICHIILKTNFIFFWGWGGGGGVFGFYLDRFFDSSGVSGELPSTFAKLQNLKMV